MLREWNPSRKGWLTLMLFLAAGLAYLACTTGTRIVYLEDEVPLAAPLEGDPDRNDGFNQDEREDPASRVARVSYVTGPVSVQPGGVEDWAPAQVNLPLKGGDALWAPAGSRAELQVGATGLRASEATSFELVRVEDGAFQVGLDQGSLAVHLLPGNARDAVEVDTPAGAITLGTAGTYRVDMASDRPDGSVTVRSGHADVTLEGEVIPVGPGKRLVLTGGDEPSFQLETAPPPDGFETWSDGRNAREAQSVGARKLGRGFIGAGDLDGAGTWKANPSLGDVWAPNVPAGWAPYRNGRWAWVEPWGWTWVDDAPWGFATSHYGRWANLGGTWNWVPQASALASGRPVYAPAMVAFVGQPTGPRRDKPIAGGGVAWFPLGPREPYVPAYRVSRTYFNRLNPLAKADRVRLPRTWANQSVPGAVTVVPRAIFTSFGEVAKANVSMGDPRFFRSAPVGPAPALPPTLKSVLPGLNGQASRPPSEMGGRPWLARTPLPPHVLPFALRQSALRATDGRPLGAAALAGLRRQGAFISGTRAWHGAEMRNAPAPLRNRAAEAMRPGRAAPGREGLGALGAQGGPTRRVDPREVSKGIDRPARPAEDRANPRVNPRANPRPNAVPRDRPVRNAERPAPREKPKAERPSRPKGGSEAKPSKAKKR